MRLTGLDSASLHAQGRVFSYILGNLLFFQLGLTFGADFLPPSWEPVRRIAETLAESLFDNKSLRTKHRAHLDRLVLSPKLGKKAKRTSALADSQNKGVRKAGEAGDVNTPHNFFIDDKIYCALSGTYRTHI